MAVGSDQGRTLDHRQLRGQGAVDVEQEAFHIKLGQQFAHRALGDDLAVVDDGQVAAQVLGLFQVVGGEDDRGAGGVDLLQHAPHVAADLDIHAGSRFVQDQQARPGHHRAGDHQPALHATGQGAAHHLRLLPQVGALELDLGHLLGFRARHAVEAGVVHEDVEGLFEQVEVDLLRHQPDQAHGGAAVAHQVAAEHLHLALAEVDQGTDDADQGGLAGTVRAQQGEEVARGHFQRDPFQGLGAVVIGFTQVAHAQGGRRIVQGSQARSLRAHGLALERGGEGLL
ncbi:hypothetical protein D3C72_1243580 [compost metagenome]